MAELSQYLCQVQLQLQMAHGAQFMALAQIQVIAVDILFILYRVYSSSTAAETEIFFAWAAVALAIGKAAQLSW